MFHARSLASRGFRVIFLSSRVLPFGFLSSVHCVSSGLKQPELGSVCWSQCLCGIGGGCGLNVVCTVRCLHCVMTPPPHGGGIGGLPSSKKIACCTYFGYLLGVPRHQIYGIHLSIWAGVKDGCQHIPSSKWCWCCSNGRT
jgi:hypothetical protein